MIHLPAKDAVHCIKKGKGCPPIVVPTGALLVASKRQECKAFYYYLYVAKELEMNTPQYNVSSPT